MRFGERSDSGILGVKTGIGSGTAGEFNKRSEACVIRINTHSIIEIIIHKPYIALAPLAQAVAALVTNKPIGATGGHQGDGTFGALHISLGDR